jgi:hypothetical protein
MGAHGDRARGTRAAQFFGWSQRRIQLIAWNRHEAETREEIFGGRCEQVDVADTPALCQFERGLGESLA